MSNEIVICSRVVEIIIEDEGPDIYKVCNIPHRGYGPWCATCTRDHRNLEVKRSEIPDAGLGLFARGRPENARGCHAFAAGELIDLYTGEVYDKAELDRRYPGSTQATYVMHYNHMQVYIDATCPWWCVARFANCLDDHVANARFEDGHPGDGVAVRLVAIRDIEWGEEITVDYGSEYEISGDESSLSPDDSEDEDYEE